MSFLSAGDAAVFSWIGAPSKGQVTPAAIKLPSLTPPLARLPPTLAYSWQGAAPTFLPHDGLTQHRDPPGPAQQRLCQRPSSRTALSMAQGPLGCPSAVTGRQPSLQSGLAGHHTNQQGLLKAFCLQQTHLV